MTQPETPADVDEVDDGMHGALAALEVGNYAEAMAGYRPPAEHATEPDQVDPLPDKASLHVPAKATTGKGE